MNLSPHYVYLSIRDDGLQYIGVRTAPPGVSPLDDSYVGSGKIMKGEKHRWKKAAMIFKPTRKEAVKAERAWLKSVDARNNPEFANESNGGGSGKKASQKTREKQRKAAMGKKCPAVAESNRRRKGEKGKKRPDNAERNRSRKGYKHTQKSKDIMVEMKLGKKRGPNSQKARANQKAAQQKRREREKNEE